MLFFVLFTSLSALLIIATPLPACRPTALGYSSCGTFKLYRRAPKFKVPGHLVAPSRKKEVLDKMMEHYETEATDAQKRAKLASATTRWNKHLPGREFMSFDYHEGGTTESPIIHPPVNIYRDRPVPKMHFIDVLYGNQEEMRVEGIKRYNDLGQDKAEQVKSMKVWGDWDYKGGIREKSKLTFHSTIKPIADKVIGDFMTIYRPLTLQIPDVPPRDRITISESVRAAHRKMVSDQPDHPAVTSNYGTVHSNWHDSLPDANGQTHRQVVVGLEELSEDEKGRKFLGNYAVRNGALGYEIVGLNTGSPPTGTPHAGPSSLNYEVAPPSSSQEQQHLNVGSPSTHALSHPRPLHTSPQQPLQPQLPHTGSPPLHDELYTLSPEVWRPWDPLSQPPHPNLHSDRLWHAGSQHLPPNNQIPLPPNNPSSQSRVGSPGPPRSEFKPSHPASPQQPRHNEFYMPSPENEFYMPSPEVWRPWDPLSQPSHEPWQSSHPDFYSDRLWHAGSPHVPSNSPPSHEPARSSSAVLTSQQLPQVQPSGGSSPSHRRR